MAPGAGVHGDCPGEHIAFNISACASETYEFVESLFEVFVRHSIDDGVDEGVEISKPREKVKDGHVEPASVLANRQYEADDEKGQPTHDEGS